MKKQRKQIIIMAVFLGFLKWKKPKPQVKKPNKNK